MTTRVLKADQSALDEAARLIRAGEVVGFPTETVYGLGANALDGAAVRKIFEAKGRPGDNPLIVHIADLDQIAPLIEGPLPPQAQALAQAFWPGPLTMILPKSGLIPPEVSAGLDTVGIRMPVHPVAQALIRRCGRPIAAPSANRSGRPSPTAAAHVLEDMDGRVPLILDGGPCGVGLESTVLDVGAQPPRVLRPGGVTPEMIAGVLGHVEVDGSALRPLEAGEVAGSPGMKYRHYAPRGAMTVVRGARAQERIAQLYDRAQAAGQRACILALEAHMPCYGQRRALSLGPDAAAAAARLFDLLRAMDQDGIERIFCEAVEARGLGLAVMNRMGRAAAFDFIDADEEGDA